MYRLVVALALICLTVLPASAGERSWSGPGYGWRHHHRGYDREDGWRWRSHRYRGRHRDYWRSGGYRHHRWSYPGRVMHYRIGYPEGARIGCLRYHDGWWTDLCGIRSYTTVRDYYEGPYYYGGRYGHGRHRNRHHHRHDDP